MPRHRLAFGVKSTRIFATESGLEIEAGKSLFSLHILRLYFMTDLGRALSFLKTMGIASNLLSTLLRGPFNVASVGPVLLFDAYPLIKPRKR